MTNTDTHEVVVKLFSLYVSEMGAQESVVTTGALYLEKSHWGYMIRRVGSHGANDPAQLYEYRTAKQMATVLRFGIETLRLQRTICLTSPEAFQPPVPWRMHSDTDPDDESVAVEYAPGSGAQI